MHLETYHHDSINDIDPEVDEVNTDKSICLSVCLSVCLFVCLSIHMYFFSSQSFTVILVNPFGGARLGINVTVTVTVIINMSDDVNGVLSLLIVLWYVHYICTHVYMCKFMYIYIHTRTLHTCIYTYIHMYVLTHIDIHIYVHTYVDLCIYIHVHT